MKQIELSISINYVKKWGIKEAIRELLQNAIDQETIEPNNKMSVDYTGNILSISNKTSKLTKSSLVLGGTDKAKSDETIGKFGEGYKLAILVLLREGIEIVIHNHYEKEVWIPTLVKSKVFNTEVLAIQITKSWFKKPDNNLTYMLHGIENIEDIMSEITLNESKYNILDTYYGKILKDGEAGKIYVNGLYVCTKPNMKYSYSIKPQFLDIGRDRDLVNDFDIYYKTSAMWQEVYKDYKDIILSDVEAKVEDMKYIIYHTTYISGGGSIGSDLAKKFNGKVPVSNEVERDLAIKKYGKNVKTFITSSQIVELTKEGITIKEIPEVSLEDKLLKFYNQNKKHFTKQMLKEWKDLTNDIK